MRVALTSSVLWERRGSLAIEFVFVVPLYLLLWMLVNHAFTLYVDVIENVADVRQCAWQFARSGCTHRPRGCTVLGPIPQPPHKAKVKQAIDRVVRSFKKLKLDLQGPFGAAYSISKKRSLEAPKDLGFQNVDTAAKYAGMCDPHPPFPWNDETVFFASCKDLGKYCW